MADNIELVGLLGEHIENSISPLIHQSFIRYYSAKYVYLPFQITGNELKDALRAVKVLKMRGLNITNPFKVQSIKFMNKIDQSAARIGAINTVVQENNKLCGHNTDWFGFQKPLQDELEFSFVDKKIIVLGAGGAARAVVYALLNGGCAKICIFNRSNSRALEIKKNFQGLYPHCQIEVFLPLKKELQKEIEGADLLVNTTPLGSWYYPDICPLPEFVKFPSSTIIYDLIYYPEKTTLLKKAENNGNVFLNGSPMLVYQAAKSFYLWTGIEPDQNIIAEILDKIKNSSIYKYL